MGFPAAKKKHALRRILSAAHLAKLLEQEIMICSAGSFSGLAFGQHF